MEWISVKDRLPEESVEYLVYVFRDVQILSFTTIAFDSLPANCFHEQDSEGYQWIRNDVKYWMPLPQPPKELERSDESEIQGDE